jgi:hypothetical protein
MCGASKGRDDTPLISPAFIKADIQNSVRVNDQSGACPSNLADIQTAQLVRNYFNDV